MYRVIFVSENTDQVDRDLIKDGRQVAKEVSLAGGYVPREIQGRRFLWNKFWLSQNLDICCLIVPHSSLFKMGIREGFRIWKINSKASSLEISEAFEGRFRGLSVQDGVFMVQRKWFDSEKRRHFDPEEPVKSWKSLDEVKLEEGEDY